MKRKREKWELKYKSNKTEEKKCNENVTFDVN